MNDWKKLILSGDASIVEVIECLNASAGAQIVLIIDNKDRLLGTITDGDLRRFMLSGGGLDGCAKNAMHQDYRSVAPDIDKAGALALMRDLTLRQIPIVDDKKKLCGLYLLSEFINADIKKNTVLIMAGGLGTRLRPLTEECPKPMLPIGGRPILETIIKNFIEEGFRDFVIAINYLGEQIRNYFGNGDALGVRINYLEEEKRLGTAGAMSLMSVLDQDCPIVMANGDLLTQVKYSHLLDFHDQTNSDFTVCLRDHHVEVPYGVVNMSGNRVQSIVEKPVIKNYISAGIYVIAPEIVARMPYGEFKDMPELISELIEEDFVVSGFPLHEYWMDVGQHNELELAEKQFDHIFG